MKQRLPKLLLASVVALFSAPLMAYGPIVVDANGTPMVHQNLSSSSPLVWTPEEGPLQDDETAHVFNNTTSANGLDLTSLAAFCASRDQTSGGSSGGGCQLNRVEKKLATATITNAQGITIVEEAWSAWSTQATDASISFGKGTSFGVDVDICNYSDYIDSANSQLAISQSTDPRICACLGTCSGSCTNPVVFDSNGDIVAAEYGEENRVAVLGTAGPIALNGIDHFVKMEAIINGACLEGSPNPDCVGSAVTLEQVKGVMIHEFGHALGLSHSQLNHGEVDIDPNTGIVSVTPDKAEYMPTMYPVIVENSTMATLHKDDKMGIAHLYPKTSLARDYCTVSGTVFHSATAGVIHCAEVVLRPVDATTQKTKAISVISGAEVKNDGTATLATRCKADNPFDCGDFQVQGLEVGVTYQIEINPVDSRFRGGSSIDPCDPPNSGDPNTGGYPSFTAFTGGQVTCSNPQTTITCNGGATNDTDLCVQVATSVTPLPNPKTLQANVQKPSSTKALNPLPFFFVGSMVLPVVGLGVKRGLKRLK